jgi:succinyl-CoA synthetase beta subunit
VVKAQVHAGGRGKGGGVKLVKSALEAREVTVKILSRPLVTPQTGPQGVPVHTILVCPAVDIAKEYYIGMVLDRKVGLVLMASAEGGVEIEEVAQKSPEKIFKESIDIRFGLQPFQARRMAIQLGLQENELEIVTKTMQGIASAFVAHDCSLVEINPFVRTKDGKILALDAKILFDDNADFRHPVYEELRDNSETPEAEIRAAKNKLSYIKLDGNIGCMVNGAGLAMSTMDIIKRSGGEPANFLDVGGGVQQDQVTEAFKIITSDPRVQAILINIFGGIAKCDLIAQGIVNAVKEMGLKFPLVVRLEGTNKEKGESILKASGLQIISATGMQEAADKVVGSIKGKK